MFDSIERLFRLLLPRKRIAVEACMELAMVWFVVRLMPYQTWSGYLNNASFVSGPLDEAAIEEARAVAQCVNAISGRLGESVTCLMKVVATRRMLCRRRIGHTINIGVNHAAPVASAPCLAHAWLDAGGFTMVGFAGKHDYTVILGERVFEAKQKTGASA